MEGVMRMEARWLTATGEIPAISWTRTRCSPFALPVQVKAKEGTLSIAITVPPTMDSTRVPGPVAMARISMQAPTGKVFTSPAWSTGPRSRQGPKGHQEG